MKSSQVKLSQVKRSFIQGSLGAVNFKIIYMFKLRLIAYLGSLIKKNENETFRTYAITFSRPGCVACIDTANVDRIL